MLMIINDYYDMVGFTLPQCAGHRQWSLLIDTNLEVEQGNTPAMSFQSDDVYKVTARSLLLFALDVAAGEPARMNLVEAGAQA